MRYHHGMAIKLSSEEREVLEFIRTACEDKGEVSEWDVVTYFRGRLTSTRILNLMDAVWQKGHTLKKYPNRIIPVERLKAVPAKKETKANVA